MGLGLPNNKNCRLAANAGNVQIVKPVMLKTFHICNMGIFLASAPNVCSPI